MADKHLTENLKGNYFSSERKDMTFLKGITLVALLPIWAGYAFALYNGDSNNLSNYSLLILAFSAMNFNQHFQYLRYDVLHRIPYRLNHYEKVPLSHGLL